MLNQCILVGRLKQWKNDSTLVLTIPRSYKNKETGEYDNDYVEVVLEGIVQENTKEYCNEGAVIGVKGRVESTDNGIIIRGEKVTFLSTSKKEDTEDEEE